MGLVYRHLPQAYSGWLVSLGTSSVKLKSLSSMDDRDEACFLKLGYISLG